MGTGHERRSQPCQDAWAWKEINGDHLCVAVADGAGSAAHSDIGARTAVATAVERVAQAVAEKLESLDADSELEGWRSPLTNVAKDVKKELDLTALQKEVAVRELACTLLLMLWTPSGIVALQVGDGAIVGRDPSGKMVALTQPEQGEYANQTVFIVEDKAAEQAQFMCWPFAIADCQNASESTKNSPQANLSHIALFSDGLQRLALELPIGKPFTPFFDPLFSFLDQVRNSLPDAADPKAIFDDAGKTLDSFLRSPRVTARTDDDLTLVLITSTQNISAPEKSKEGS